MTAESLAELESRKAHLNEAANVLMELTDPQTSRVLEEELRRFNLLWTDFVRTNTLVSQRFYRSGVPRVQVKVAFEGK